MAVQGKRLEVISTERKAMAGDHCRGPLRLSALIVEETGDPA